MPSPQPSIDRAVLDTLAERMHTEEHRLLVEAVTRLLADRQR